MTSGMTSLRKEHVKKEDDGPYERYSKERILTVLGRVRRAGGIPMEEKTMKHVACWLRGLGLRGLIDGKLLGDASAAKEAYRTFENPTTRGQYARAVISYIGGLTDDEFSSEYPDIARGDVVRLMKDIITESGKEVKEKRKTET